MKKENAADTVSMADAARMLRMSYNGIKTRVKTGVLVPDITYPGNKDKGVIYRFYVSTIENLIKDPPMNLHKDRHEQKRLMNDLIMRVEKLEQLIGAK